MNRTLLALSILACSAQPCGWHKMNWSPPPPEDLPDVGCVMVVAARGTGIAVGEIEGCPDLDHCGSAAPEFASFLEAYVDTSREGWESRPPPRLLTERRSCWRTDCAEVKRLLITEQGEDLD